MSFEITEAFVDQFRDNILLLSQQKESRLRACCKQEDVVGEYFYAERVGATEAQEITTRHGDTPQVDTPHSRRRGTMRDFNWADKIDRLDKVKMLIDPQSTYAQNARNAMNRKLDDLIIAALGGTAQAGRSGGTTVNNYDAGECRLMAGDGTLATAGSDHSDTTETGLTIAKLGTLGELMDEAEIDEDRERFIVTNPYNLWLLLQDTTVGSLDYNEVKTLYRGKIDKFMGFTFKRLATNRFTENATDSGCIECYAFAQGAISIGIGEEIVTEIDRLPTKNYSTQVYVEMSFGATRNEGPAVIEVLLKKEA